MTIHHENSSRTDSILVESSEYELSHGPASRFLHGNPFGIGTLAQRLFLIFGQSQDHGHAELVSD